MADLFVEGTPVPLTTLESQLIAILADQADSFVPKEIIYERLYAHYMMPPEPKILDVVICHVRKKITGRMQIPEHCHYLISDHRGGVGLFSTPQSMEVSHRKLGQVSKINRRLNKLRLYGFP